MEAIGLFLLKSAAWLTGFALVYLLLLRNERYFRLNRIFLLAGIIASLLFPFYTFHYAVVLPSLPTDSAFVGDLMVGGVVTDQPAVPFYYWIYLAGMLLFLLRLLFQTWKIIRKLRKAGHEQTGAVKLVRTADYASSFSFFSYVFVNPSTSAHEMREIMNHEQEHIRQRHWLDLLLVELVCIVQWFNPLAWVYAHLVRQNHEYLADERALATTADPVIYQAALLNQLLGAPVFRLTNSFSYSLNKKRFKMMKKKIDSPFRKLKMLVVLPLAAMLFYAFAVPEYHYASEITSEAPQGKTLDVKGQVLKSEGHPLPGTSVILRGSTMGTITDQEGNFLMKGIPADGELVFSFVGFQSKVQKVTAKPMKIVLNGEKVALDQVTVVGYGATPPPPPPPPPPANFMDGSNPPLILLDGVLISKAEMDKISPETIESINVLKDKANTEIYGEKGKNGVVLIKSKGQFANKSDSQVNSDKKAEIFGADKDNPPLYFVDGVLTDPKDLGQTKPDLIDNISVLKGRTATDLYGDKGKNGAVFIYTKAKAASQAGKGVPYSADKTENQDGLLVFRVVEEMPEFPGGEQALRNFIGSNIKYPDYAVKKNLQGTVFITFVVKSDGTVGNAKVVRGVDASLDQEALRVVNLMPAWKPGKQKGQAVNVAYTIPVQFKLDGDKIAKVALPQFENVPQQRPDGVYIVVEEMPEFPGGELALRDFIVHNCKYPAAALKDSIQGKVFVTFVVKADGTVGDAKIARGVDPLLDQEAIRVVSSLPAWKPGKNKGKEVSVSYTVPVKFALDDGKQMKTPRMVPTIVPDKNVFVVVEEMPEFPGGAVELRKFIASAVKYPIEAVKDKAQGRVFVSFVVNSLGKIEKAKIERSVHPALDAEAIRVVSQMPEWKPGKQHGEAVSVQYTIPIEFKLQ